jgi:Zn-dependent peptidase ImmA (M78 family)
MDESTMPGLLEELLERFGVRIRYETIKQDQNVAYVPGGLCILKGEYVLIVNACASTREKVMTLATGLKHFDLDKVYIRPDVRQLLDKIPEQRPFNTSSA